MQSLSSVSFAQPPCTSEFRSVLRESDADAVARLVVGTGVFSTAEVGIAQSLVEETRAGAPGTTYRFLIADGIDGIDAYTCFGPIPGTERRYELYWIAVDAALHHRGLGRALLAETERAVHALGGTHLFVHTSTRADYAPARTFYLANGYTQHTHVPDYYSDGDGMAIYGKRL